MSRERQSSVLITPSPGTPGEGWGEGDLEHQRLSTFQITLTPALSRSTGRGSERRRKGKITARLLIFLAIVSFPFCWFAYVFVNQTLTGGIEKHGDYSVVDLKSLGNYPLDGSNGSINDVPSRWRDLDGKRVLLEGFMYAPNAAGYDVNDFQFVYNISKCCFNGPPLVQERVFVNSPKAAVPYYSDLVRVVGTLHVSVVKEAGIIKSIYTLELEKVNPA